MDTSNKFLVGSQAGNIVFMRPVPQSITADDALLLAAYLVSIQSPGVVPRLLGRTTGVAEQLSEGLGG